MLLDRAGADSGAPEPLEQQESDGEGAMEISDPTMTMPRSSGTWAIWVFQE
ncbi:hypothetical protein ACFQZ4_50575 [Catellatospora coxensis]